MKKGEIIRVNISQLNLVGYIEKFEFVLIGKVLSWIEIERDQFNVLKDIGETLVTVRVLSVKTKKNASSWEDAVKGMIGKKMKVLVKKDSVKVLTDAEALGEVI